MILAMSLHILNICFMLMILVHYIQIIILKELCNNINKNLEELQTWFIVSKSLYKKNYMIFSNKKINKSNFF